MGQLFSKKEPEPQASVMKNKSQMSRDNGNKIFQSITDDLDPTERRDSLQKCLGSYNIAMDSAYTNVDKMAASKNLGIASYKMALCLEEQNEDEKLMEFYVFEALKYFPLALKYGEEQALEWRQHLINKLAECVVWWMSPGYLIPSESRGGVRERVAEKIPNCAKAAVNLQLADKLFKNVLKRQEFEEVDLKECLRHLHECQQLLEEAKQFCCDEAQVIEVECSQDDIFIEMCMAEAKKALQTGESLLEFLLDDEDDLNIEMVWETIDWFQQAIILSRTKDLEVEAIASSNVGYIYDKILKMKGKAKKHFQNSVKLAHSLEPKNVTTEAWYKTACEILEQYQIEYQLEEEKKWENERKKYLEELKPELDKLKNICDEYPNWKTNKPETKKSRKEFLEKIYKEFPPKNAKYKMVKIDMTDESAKKAKEKSNKETKEKSEGSDQKVESKNTVKKAYQIAVTHYHPDRHKEEYGQKWKVLSEEVCKELTSRYENMKL